MYIMKIVVTSGKSKKKINNFSHTGLCCGTDCCTIYFTCNYNTLNNVF